MYSDVETLIYCVFQITDFSLCKVTTNDNMGIAIRHS